MISIALVKLSSLSNPNEELLKAARDQRAGDVGHLLRKPKVNIDTRAKDEGTPLHFSASGGNAVITRMLIDKGANINAKNKLGRTPLHVAAEKDHFFIMKLLLQKGANIEYKDRNGLTALHLVSYAGHTSAVRLLLEYGAVANVTDNQGKTALYLAKEGNHHPIVTILESAIPKSVTSYTMETKNTKIVVATPLLTDTDESGDDDSDEDGRVLEGQRNTVQKWLNDRIPQLRPNDCGSYASVLMGKGFDSIETLMQVLQPNDLNHMKTGHVRILAMKLKKEGHNNFQD